jgi:glycerol-3-phosphate acyltransferase PlsY
MEYFVIIIVAIISYLIGSVNFSIILSRAVSGKDIRESGSGNAGATNMLRTHGKKMGVITLLLDVLKGIAAILLAVLAVKLFLGGSTGDDATPDYSFVKYIAGVCVILGHNFPLYFGFKGGKGVATSLGVVLMLDWKAGLIVAVFALIIIVLTRYVSLGSILGGAAYILTELLTMDINKDIIRIICVIIIGGLLIIRHHANIMRLLNGTENKLGAKK